MSPRAAAAAGLLTDDRLPWFVTRGSGVVVLVLLTGSMVLGVLSTVRASSSWWPRFVTQALHRNIALIALALLAVHAGTAIAYGYLGLSLLDAVVPFRSTGRAFWGSVGTIALDLVLVSTATGLARHRLRLRGWRIVHRSAYLAWPLALAHGLGMGSDQHAGWSIVLTAVCVGVVAGAVSLRVTGLAEERRLEPGHAEPRRAPSGRRAAR